MKRLSRITITILSFFLLAGSSIAANVQFEWEMTDTTGVTGYKLYYSQDPGMANKIWHQECASPVEDPPLSFTMNCTNVNIDTNQTTYFTIAAATAKSEVESDIRTITVEQAAPSLAVVQDFQIVVGDSLPSPSTFNAAINFQPSNASVPNGYQADTGAAFDASTGYGWIQLPGSLGERDRDNSASPNQAYDTLIHVKPTAAWEIALTNGTYKVTICMGDPSYPTGTPNVQAEGITVISGQTLSTTKKWIENNANIQVTDGRLTITFTGSTDPARLCWIKIESL